MGRRGRDNAKQKKVARELKYNSPFGLDLAALQRELAAKQSTNHYTQRGGDTSTGENPYDNQ